MLCTRGAQLRTRPSRSWTVQCTNFFSRKQPTNDALPQLDFPPSLCQPGREVDERRIRVRAIGESHTASCTRHLIRCLLTWNPRCPPPPGTTISTDAPSVRGRGATGGGGRLRSDDPSASAPGGGGAGGAAARGRGGRDVSFSVTLRLVRGCCPSLSCTKSWVVHGGLTNDLPPSLPYQAVALHPMTVPLAVTPPSTWRTTTLVMTTLATMLALVAAAGVARSGAAALVVVTVTADHSSTGMTLAASPASASTAARLATAPRTAAHPSVVAVAVAATRMASVAPALPVARLAIAPRNAAALVLAVVTAATVTLAAPASTVARLAIAPLTAAVPSAARMAPAVALALTVASLVIVPQTAAVPLGECRLGCVRAFGLWLWLCVDMLSLSICVLLVDSQCWRAWWRRRRPWWWRWRAWQEDCDDGGSVRCCSGLLPWR